MVVVLIFGLGLAFVIFEGFKSLNKQVMGVVIGLIIVLVLLASIEDVAKGFKK